MMNRFDLMTLRYRTWCSTLANTSTYHTNCELVILLVKSIFKRSNMWIARRKTTCPKQVDKTFFEPWLKNLYKLIIISDSSFNPKLDNCLPKKRILSRLKNWIMQLPSGGTPRIIGKGCAACFLKPWSNARTKSVIFPTLVMMWLIPYLRPKWPKSKLIPSFWSKRLKNILYSLGPDIPIYSPFI